VPERPGIEHQGRTRLTARTIAIASAGSPKSCVSAARSIGIEIRIYFGQDGKMIVILLCGGTKKRQNRDIATAKSPVGGLQDAQAGRTAMIQHGR
jgi:putative addiction module killer protein